MESSRTLHMPPKDVSKSSKSAEGVVACLGEASQRSRQADKVTSKRTFSHICFCEESFVCFVKVSLGFIAFNDARVSHCSRRALK